MSFGTPFWSVNLIWGINIFRGNVELLLHYKMLSMYYRSSLELVLYVKQGYQEQSVEVCNDEVPVLSYE